jgi:hypothetical protein
MASIRRELRLETSADAVWAALRDFGEPHTRLVRGFVTDARLDGLDRIVTFFNGVVVRERLVDLDDDARRLVWSIVDGPYSHHNGSAQVFATDGGGATLVWISDLLPDEAAERTAAMMDRGLAAIQQTLDG